LEIYGVSATLYGQGEFLVKAVQARRRGPWANFVFLCRHLLCPMQFNFDWSRNYV